MRRFVLIAVVALFATGAAAPAGAQDEPATTTTVAESPAADIIPRPNSGAAPAEAGDRGGALQLALLAGVILALVGGVASVVRQSRRAQPGRDA